MADLKKFMLVQTCAERPTGVTVTNWALCVICQEDTPETPVCPLQSKRRETGTGYKTLSANLIKFAELGKLLATLQLERLDDGEGIEAAMVAHEAKYHKTCMLRYNTTKLRRAEKRSASISSAVGVVPSSSGVPGKCTRSHSCDSAKASEPSCFFCGEAGSDSLHEAATFQLDERVRRCAEQTGDNQLLAKLSMGDMVALEAKYHTKCLVALYNRAKTTRDYEQTGEESVVDRIVLSELVLHIEEAHTEENTAPVFKLAELGSLYTRRMQQLGAALGTKVNTTRLKERLLAHVTGLRAQTKGRDVLLAFDEDIGDALGKACKQDSDSEVVHLARAARIVRQYLFEDIGPFSGSFQKRCQKNSVPSMLVALINMVLEGPSIKNQCDYSSQAALSIAQLLKFNSVKHHRKEESRSFEKKRNDEPLSVRHSTSQETPLPLYIGLMLHAQTRKRGLVDKLSSLGLSISYDRVLRLSAEMGNRACRLFHMEQVVCPTNLRGNVFTTAAVDNIDHNPSATTAKDSFHGTGISLMQHPNCEDEGVGRGFAITADAARSKTVDNLPQYYTDVPPVASTVKGSPVPATSVTSLERNNFKKHKEYEYRWLENTRTILKDDEDRESTSWAAYHTRHHDPKQTSSHQHRCFLCFKRAHTLLP